MATSKSLLGCLSAEGLTNVPKDIASLAAAGNRQAMIEAVKTHIAGLESHKKDIGVQRNIIIDQGRKASTAGSYTNRSADVGNELNTFTPRGMDALRKNVVQRVGSVAAALKNKMLGENEVTSNERKVIQHFDDSFNPRMDATIEKLYKQVRTLFKDDDTGDTKIDDRYKDMMQYLPRYERVANKRGYVSWKLLPTSYTDADGKVIMENKLDGPTKAAIAATAYEWLHTNGSKALQQNDPSLRSLLDLAKDADIPKVAYTHLKNVGVKSDALAAELGKTILQRMSIASTGDSDALAQSRMELSLGFMAIAAMEDMDYLERQEVFTGELSELAADSDKRPGELPQNAFGFAGIKEGADLGERQVFFQADSANPGKDIHGRTREGTPTMTFVRLISTDYDGKFLTTPKKMDEGKALMKDNARYAFDKLFANESTIREFSWKKIKLPKQMKIGRSNELATVKQTENIQKYADIPYERSEATMGLFLAMDLRGEAIDRIMGMVSSDDKLDLREDSIDGINRGINNDLEAILDFNLQADEQLGDNPYFYLPSEFQNNERMGQKGSITLQGSKMHRNLFRQAGWATSFKSSPAGQSKIDKDFKSAIAFAFGIESGKVGGFKNQLKQFDALVTHPAMVSALNAISEFHAGLDMDTDLEDRIAAGVELGGEKLHSLKGLIEYSRYLDHRDTTPKADFHTDIYKEIDGVSNGPVIGIMQLIPDSAEMRAVLASVAMGGMSVNPNEVNLDEEIGKKNLNDAYQRMGQEWALQLALLKEKLLGEGKKSQVQYAQATALGVILKPFQDESGVISNVVRKLSKPRTMQTIYGAGTKAQTALLAGSDVINDGIYKEMEAIMADVKKGVPSKIVEARLEKLLENITILTNRRDKVSNYRTNGSLDIALLSVYELSASEIVAVTSAVESTYGAAMATAINAVYKDIIEARQPFNTAIQLDATVYNAILQKRVDNKLEAKRAAVVENLRDKVVITKDELNEILESIKDLAPKIKTPLFNVNEEKGGYLPLVSVGKNKNYANTAVVSQSYDGLALNKGYAEDIPLLDKAGAGPMVRAIQMIDSMIANHLMGIDTHMLNNHDGFSHGFSQSDAIRVAANERFIEIMKTYSLGKEINDMHKALAEAQTEALDDLDIDPKEMIDKLIDDGVVTPDMVAIDDGAIQAMKDAASDISDKKGIGYFEALAQVTKAEVENQDAYDQNFVDHIFSVVARETDIMADQTTANLGELTDAITHSAQYPDNGVGVDVESVTTGDSVFFVNRDKVLSVDAQNTDDTVGELKDLVAKGFGSADAFVSTDVNNYPDPTQINSRNITENFDRFVDADVAAEHSSNQDSAEHVSYLKGVLDNIVAKVMVPIDLYKAASPNDQETMGLYSLDKESGKNKMWIQTQKLTKYPRPGALGQGIRMSSAEVFAHEMIHHVTHFGLKNDSYLFKQAYDLYDQFRNAHLEQNGENAYRVFLNDPYGSIDIDDPNSAAEHLAAQARWKHVFEAKRRKDGGHNGVDEFIALGMSNANFRRQLGYIAMDPKKFQKKSFFELFEKNVQTTIVNIFNKIMDVINMTFRKQKHSTTMAAELEDLTLALSQVESRAKSAEYRLDVAAENKLTAMSVKFDEKVKSWAVKTMTATNLGQALTGYYRDTTGAINRLPEMDNMISHQMRLVLNWYNNKEAGLIPSIVTEMVGTTERVKPLHHLLSRRNRVIDAAKSEAADNIRKAVNSQFKRELSNREKTAITKALLKTDISSLEGLSTHRAIIGFLTNATQREDRISMLLDKVKADKDLVGYATFFENAADDLGYYMVTSSSRDGDVAMMNSHNIVLMHGTPNADKLPDGTPAHDKAMELVDQLATLSSLRYVAMEDKHTLARLMREDLGSIEGVMHHHRRLKEDAAANQFNRQESLMQKGYTKEILNSRIQYEQGTLADQKKMEDRGFVMQATPIARDPADPVQEDIYMFKSTLGMVNDMQSGIASTTGNTAMGTDAYKIQQQIGNTYNPAAQADRNTARMVQVVTSKLANMSKVRVPYYQRPKQNANNMIPKFNPDGNIVGMRYMMTEQTKDVILEQFSEFDSVMAAMTSQVVDKKHTPEINAELISALRDMYDHKVDGFTANPAAYVEISATSTVERHRDIWHMLPPKAQQQAISTFGGPRIMVARDVVDLAFGQRKYSIVEMFGKTPGERNLFEQTMAVVMNFALGMSNPFVHVDDQSGSKQGRAVNRAKRIEDTMIQLTKLAKSNIIVRNFSVTRGNWASNMAYLKSKGISLHKIRTLSQEAVTSSLEYQRDNTQLQALRHQREITSRKSTISQMDKNRILGNLDRKIERLENMLANNPSTAMIEAGLMPAIVDDVDTGSLQSPHKFGLEAAIESGLSFLPKPAEKAARVLFMSEDSEGYKMLNNGVKMTDYVGRYVLYDHYIKKQGMSHSDAISAVNDEFINFDLSTHKSLEYLNNIGLLWFSKYQLRVLKHIKNVVKEQPFTALATFILGSFIGNNNILNSVPGITKDVLQAWGDPMSSLLSSVDQTLYYDLATDVSIDRL